MGRSKPTDNNTHHNNDHLHLPQIHKALQESKNWDTDLNDEPKGTKSK